MKIVYFRKSVHMINMDMFQFPQLNKPIRNSPNLMYLAMPIVYKAESGSKLDVVSHMMTILL